MATDKRSQAEETLSTDERDEFARLVEDYQSSCAAHARGAKFVNYNILADLIRWGWRKVS